MGRGKIQYIYHNCFYLSIDNKDFLFDIPSSEHLPEDGQPILYNVIQHSKQLYIFFSHSHEDHFGIEFVSKIKDIKKNTIFFISYDIYSLNPSLFEQNSHILEPEDEYDLEGLKIKTFESNDLGNAYLIKVQDKKIYFGGDLAEWIWPDTKEAEKKAIQQYFEEILNELKEEGIYIAFSNMDPRLRDFGGTFKFIDIVKPKYFVPMHSFGIYNHFKRLLEIKDKTLTKFFIYNKVGDIFNIIEK